jgi:hypothetical protein
MIARQAKHHQRPSTPPSNRSSKHKHSPTGKRNRRGSGTSPQKGKCFLYDGLHYLRECPHVDAAKATARQERMKQRDEKYYRRQKAYPAEERPSSSGSSITLTPEKDVAHLSERTVRLLQDDEQRRKLSLDRWIIDTGASSHMTDQKGLFSGSTIEPYPGNIRVGGGSLAIQGRGKTKLELGVGFSLTLRNTLFVPFLGANLLSVSKLCKAGMYGEFNSDTLDMKSKITSKLVIRAKKQGGVYIVQHISKDSQNFAFPVSVCKQEHAFTSTTVTTTTPI